MRLLKTRWTKIVLPLVMLVLLFSVARKFLIPGQQYISTPQHTYRLLVKAMQANDGEQVERLTTAHARADFLITFHPQSDLRKRSRRFPPSENLTWTQIDDDRAAATHSTGGGFPAVTKLRFRKTSEGWKLDRFMYFEA